MTRGRAIVVAAILGAAGAAPFWWPDRAATADLPGGGTVTMLVRPMAGIHSDWHRRLVISTEHGAREVALFADTGWWRGSNLHAALDLPDPL